MLIPQKKGGALARADAWPGAFRWWAVLVAVNLTSVAGEAFCAARSEEHTEERRASLVQSGHATLRVAVALADAEPAHAPQRPSSAGSALFAMSSNASSEEEGVVLAGVLVLALLVVAISVCVMSWSRSAHATEAPASPKAPSHGPAARSLTPAAASRKPAHRACTGANACGAGPDEEDQPEATLCEDLVVPEMDECTLEVPCLPEWEQHERGRQRGTVRGLKSFPVSSTQGFAVFEVFYSLDQREVNGGGRCLVLQNPTGEVSFASCRGGDNSQAGLPTITVHGASEAQFGSLSVEPGAQGNAIFVARGGRRITFRGRPNTQAVDDQNRLLASSVPMGPERRSIRIGPMVDAGLIVVCFVGRDLLEHRMARRREGQRP